MILIWVLLRWHAYRLRVGQGVQQAVVGREVGCAGPDPLARDEFEGGDGGRSGLDVQPRFAGTTARPPAVRSWYASPVVPGLREWPAPVSVPGCATAVSHLADPSAVSVL